MWLISTMFIIWNKINICNYELWSAIMISYYKPQIFSKNSKYSMGYLNLYIGIFLYANLKIKQNNFVTTL